MQERRASSEKLTTDKNVMPIGTKPLDSKTAQGTSCSQTETTDYEPRGSRRQEQQLAGICLGFSWTD
jgi:hypothetical protein